MYELKIHMMGAESPIEIKGLTEQELENILIELKTARDEDRFAHLERSGTKELLNIDNLLRVEYTEQDQKEGIEKDMEEALDEVIKYTKKK